MAHSYDGILRSRLPQFIYDEELLSSLFTEELITEETLKEVIEGGVVRISNELCAIFGQNSRKAKKLVFILQTHKVLKSNELSRGELP